MAYHNVEFQRHRTQYVCADEAPETTSGGDVFAIQSEFFVVEVGCETLPCASFLDGIELNCVVCSIYQQ